MSRDVQHAVDVEENPTHGRRVYSGDAVGLHPTLGDRPPLLALEHAQKSDTRVEALFDVEASSALTDTQKRRVVTRGGQVLRAVAQDERSQWRNRELATERLVEELRQALRVPRKRRPTRPTKASKEKRLERKRRRSNVKRLRRPPE